MTRESAYELADEIYPLVVDAGVPLAEEIRCLVEAGWTWDGNRLVHPNDKDIWRMYKKVDSSKIGNSRRLDAEIGRPYKSLSVMGSGCGVGNEHRAGHSVIGQHSSYGRQPGAAGAGRAGRRAARFAWDEFFYAEHHNPHTQKAYMAAVQRFLALGRGARGRAAGITPKMVGQYLVGLGGSAAKRNLHLSALRGFFDRLVNRHVFVLNPAASVKGVKEQVIEGKTPEITIEQARTLLASIDTGAVIGLRDRAIVAHAGLYRLPGRGGGQAADGGFPA